MGARARLIATIALLAVVLVILYFENRSRSLPEGKEPYFFQDDPLPDSSDLYALCFSGSRDYIFRFLRGPQNFDRYGAAFSRVLQKGRDSLIHLGSDPALFANGDLILVEKIDAVHLSPDAATELQINTIRPIIEKELKRKVERVKRQKADLLFILNKK